MEGGGSESARELDQTPTWAVALVSAVIIIISILLEKTLHKFGETFERRKKKALFEALEKIKGELMVLGFISLILTFGQNYISKICIPEKIGDTMLPCPNRSAGNEEHKSASGAEAEHHRRLLWYKHRMLSGDSPPQGCKKGYVPLMSINGIHQLHIFIFFLAVFHVIYSAITMMLGRLKIRGWKEWERQTVNEYEVSNDPSRFRLTHETSFVRDHTSFWTRNPILFYTVCFYRQFFRSVRKADYLTMRHGFISVHLAPGSKFDFQKYIKRSLEDDFKVIVGINTVLWMSAVVYMLLNVQGWQSMFWLSIMPLVIILAVGTKLQAIITKMAVEIQERHAVVQGIPLVQVSDSHFWFSWPKLVLHLIHLTLFQNAFEITNFIWISYEFGMHSCFHENFYLSIFRVVLGLGVQFLCSYITLPLYALVTQMGSNMKKSIFDEHTSKALMKWHKHAKKKKEERPQPHTKKLGGSPGDSPDSSPRISEARGGTVSVDIPVEDLLPDNEKCRHRDILMSP
ncbi:MLO-like protein 9 [Olea europaea var. sylvestris]|uniref:MLO-like protein n=1 Tax=Olea europaea subsp. europaea TaxID=158383 RepID=A0A8S0TK45_OLEEU|nr:MLO-like protein 9 [Olea europaea var. sylvestris]CAA3005841.1 MLO 9 [Olea europaea subsp. europaea]